LAASISMQVERASALLTYDGEINHDVAKLLEKLRIEFTACGVEPANRSARHSPIVSDRDATQRFSQRRGPGGAQSGAEDRCGHVTGKPCTDVTHDLRQPLRSQFPQRHQQQRQAHRAAQYPYLARIEAQDLGERRFELG